MKKNIAGISVVMLFCITLASGTVLSGEAGAASDQEIQATVQQVLDNAAQPNGNGGGSLSWAPLTVVRVEDGQVYLKGTLKLKSQMELVEGRLLRVPGVSKVSLFRVDYQEDDLAR